jgi:glycosyltransferase involved in cell wall biosynthesis
MSAPARALAIVIPAYKARFLDATLASIAAQTRRDFTVYVGDDASPEPLQPIVERWRERLDLCSTRFATNLGGRDLVAQWQRCVELSSEPWVWLFSDDDLMPPDAVARVLAAIEEEGQGGAAEAAEPAVPLLHLHVDTIDAEGRLVRHEPRFPPRLSARAFLRGRLRFELSSFAPDYVFARAAFERAGGFVPLPRAWCADDASWAALAAPAGIRTLDGAPIAWRLSGDNISSRHGSDGADKLEAQLGFLRWIDGFLRAHPARAGEPGDAELRTLLAPWFFRQLRHLGLRLEGAAARRVRAALAQCGGASGLALRWDQWQSNRRVARDRRRSAAASAVDNGSARA